MFSEIVTDADLSTEKATAEELHELTQFRADAMELIENLIAMSDKLIVRIEYLQHEEPENITAHKLLESQLKTVEMILKKSGVQILNETGIFDPSYQSVVQTIPSEEEGQVDTIAEVYSSGYRYRGKLLRPQKVIIFSKACTDNI